MNVSVGVVGLGNMGTAIAENLTSNGVPVTGWTRSGIDPDWARKNHIAEAKFLKDLVAASEIVILSLFDDHAVSSVFDLLLSFDLHGKLVVDTSTVDPGLLVGYADRFRAAGASVLDAPISGWPAVVAKGQAGVLIGGGAQDVERYMPIAEHLSNRIFHIGPLGQGLAAKIVNNMMLAGYWQCLKESMQVGQSLGLTSEKMLEVLMNGPAANGALAGKSEVIKGSETPASFTVAGVAKDLTVFVSVANQAGVDVHAIGAALNSFETHRDAGNGAMDFATMVNAALEQDK